MGFSGGRAPPSAVGRLAQGQSVPEGPAMTPPRAFNARRRTQARPRTVSDWMGLAIESLIAVILIFTPWPLGVVSPWSEAITIVLTTAVALCLLVRLLTRDWAQASRPVGWAFAAPVAAFILFVGLQLVSVPGGLLRAIAPGTFELKNQLLSDVPGVGPTLRAASLTFYAAATRHELRVVLTATTLFFAGTQIFTHAAPVKRLLAVVAAVGGAVGLLAAQDLSGADHVYWLIPTPHGAANAGPFIHYSNYAQYINLCAGRGSGAVPGAGGRAAAGRPGR